MSKSDRENTKGTLIVISGPSGVGKSTVCQEMIKRANFRRVVTGTTRAPRAGEAPGEDYHFFSRDEFEAGLKKDGFLEHALVHGNYYGTPRASVEEGLAAGDNLLLAIDVQGAEQIRGEFRGAAGARDQAIAAAGKLVTIFLMAPDEKALSKRLRGRGTESEAQVEQRLSTAQVEILEQDKYDRIVVNDRLEDTVAEILALLGNAVEKDHSKED